LRLYIFCAKFIHLHFLDLKFGIICFLCAKILFICILNILIHFFAFILAVSHFLHIFRCFSIDFLNLTMNFAFMFISSKKFAFTSIYFPRICSCLLNYIKIFNIFDHSLLILSIFTSFVSRFSICFCPFFSSLSNFYSPLYEFRSSLVNFTICVIIVCFLLAVFIQILFISTEIFSFLPEFPSISIKFFLIPRNFIDFCQFS
jgi:hypothetical protein